MCTRGKWVVLCVLVLCGDRGLPWAGCVPKKVMWSCAEVMEAVHDAPDYGIDVTYNGQSPLFAAASASASACACAYSVCKEYEDAPALHRRPKK